MKITRIIGAECKLPLPRPIRLGPVEIKTRDFVALRLETDAGISGDALGYPRGTALSASAERLAPLALGRDVHARRGVTEDLLNAFINGRPTFVKAASLYDIALWDAAAKEVEQPLATLLGGGRTRAPVMVVAGYYPDVRPVADICDEVRRRIDEGYERIKIMIRGDDALADLTLVDLKQSWTVDSAAFQSKARNCPFAGMELPGRVVRTLVGGKTVYHDNQVVCDSLATAESVS